MNPTFYAMVDYGTGDAYWISNDDGVPQAFETEAAAIEASKSYTGCPVLILKSVALVTEKTTHKVTKIK